MCVLYTRVLCFHCACLFDRHDFSRCRSSHTWAFNARACSVGTMPHGSDPYTPVDFFLALPLSGVACSWLSCGVRIFPGVFRTGSCVTCVSCPGSDSIRPSRCPERPPPQLSQGLRYVLRRVLYVLVRHVPPKGKRGGRHACVGRGFCHWEMAMGKISTSTPPSFAAPSTSFAASFTCPSFTCGPRADLFHFRPFSLHVSPKGRLRAPNARARGRCKKN